MNGPRLLYQSVPLQPPSWANLCGPLPPRSPQRPTTLRWVSVGRVEDRDVSALGDVGMVSVLIEGQGFGLGWVRYPASPVEVNGLGQASAPGFKWSRVRVLLRFRAGFDIPPHQLRSMVGVRLRLTSGFSIMVEVTGESPREAQPSLFGTGSTAPFPQAPTPSGLSARSAVPGCSFSPFAPLPPLRLPPPSSQAGSGLGWGWGS